MSIKTKIIDIITCCNDEKVLKIIYQFVIGITGNTKNAETDKRP